MLRLGGVEPLVGENDSGAPGCGSVSQCQYSANQLKPSCLA